MSPNAPFGIGRTRAFALAALAAAVSSCGPGEIYSRVARDPASYSEDERLAEIARLDALIDTEASRIGLVRAEHGRTVTLISEPGTARTTAGSRTAAPAPGTGSAAAGTSGAEATGTGTGGGARTAAPPESYSADGDGTVKHAGATPTEVAPTSGGATVGAGPEDRDGSSDEEASGCCGERTWCDKVCDSARAICEAAENICRIADSMPGHATARARCERARTDCDAARDVARPCGCRWSKP
ncbi:MAG TPA: hypothetical protein VG389_10465 [Myxococcota bacterium]|jgi:hypothetical protein|nr:hypothetical protein [Myxococcota bacterium]